MKAPDFNDLHRKNGPDAARDAFDDAWTGANGRGADPADGFITYWHGSVALGSSRPWLVYETIPEVGTGLLSGQWGTFKTFVALDLACAVMSGTPIFGSDIDRRGGPPRARTRWRSDSTQPSRTDVQRSGSVHRSSG
jgi:hypothetical protein